MSDLLTKFNQAGLIERLEGSDQRFGYMEAAATKLAATFESNPPYLIRAILAGLDPDISESDPLIIKAEEFLLEEWVSMRSIYVDRPILICRSILLDACDQVSQNGSNALILWNTVADTLPFIRLRGREEAIVREVLLSWAYKAEATSQIVIVESVAKNPPATKGINIEPIEHATKAVVDSDLVKRKVAEASGPSHPQPWANQFAIKMADLLIDRINAIHSTSTTKQNELIDSINKSSSDQTQAIKDLLASHRSWMKEALDGVHRNQKAEQLQLDVLWWSSSMYSASFGKSYRDFSPIVSSLIMPLELLRTLQLPVSASVSYTLFETVRKLHIDDCAQELSIKEVLDCINDHRTELQALFLGEESIPDSGRLSIRDILLSTLSCSKEENISLLASAGINAEAKITLPRLAQTIFRQQQAVLLAGAACG